MKVNFNEADKIMYCRRVVTNGSGVELVEVYLIIGEYESNLNVYWIRALGDEENTTLHKVNSAHLKEHYVLSSEVNKDFLDICIEIEEVYRKVKVNEFLMREFNIINSKTEETINYYEKLKVKKARMESDFNVGI